MTAGMTPPFLTSTLNGGTPAAVLPGKKPRYTWSGRFVGPQEWSGRFGKEKNL